MGSVSMVSNPLNAWKLAAGCDVVEWDESAPKIQLVDGGAEANRALRRQLADTLCAIPCVTGEFFAHIFDELGFNSGAEATGKPLEARQVRQIIDEVENHVAVEKIKAARVAIEETTRLMYEAFDSGMDMEFDELAESFGGVVPDTSLSEVRLMAVNVFREQMAQHLDDVRQVLRHTIRQLPSESLDAEKVRAAVAEYRSYGHLVLEEYRRFAKDARYKFDLDRVKGLTNVFNVLGMAVGLIGRLMVFQAKVHLYKVECRLAARRAALQAFNERMEKKMAEIDAACAELKAKLRQLAGEGVEDQQQEAAESQAAIESLLIFIESNTEDLVQLVAGYDAREEQLRAEVREDMTGHKTTI